jgi:hypothetical protein
MVCMYDSSVALGATPPKLKYLDADERVTRWQNSLKRKFTDGCRKANVRTQEEKISTTCARKVHCARTCGPRAASVGFDRLLYCQPRFMNLRR